MPVVDRMEFPRRYKLKESVIVVIIIAAVFGIWLQRKSLNRLSQQIEISEVQFGNYGSQFIEVQYRITNKSKQDRQLSLMVKVWDRDSLEIASALFSIESTAGSSHKRTKLLDRLNRTLQEGERPYKAEVSLYKRKVL